MADNARLVPMASVSILYVDNYEAITLVVLDYFRKEVVPEEIMVTTSTIVVVTNRIVY